MKYLVVSKRRSDTAPADTLQPALRWVKAKLADRTLDCCYGLPEGGAISIMNAQNHEDLMRQLIQYPQSRWLDYEVHPLCDIEQVFEELEKWTFDRGLVHA